MCAVEDCICGQLADTQYAAPHLFARALEQPAATQREQGVADEGIAAGAIDIADMAERMTSQVDDVEAGLAQIIDIARHDDMIERPVLSHLGRTVDRAAKARLDLGIATAMVGMPMGIEDNVDAVQAEVFDRGDDFRRFGRVDGGDTAAGLVDGQKAVIVLQAGDDMYF